MTTSPLSPTALSRRGFLQASTATGLGVVLAGSIDAVLGTAANAAGRTATGYGPLLADPAGLLALPRGFSYELVAVAGQTVMADGSLTPADFDAVGAFSTGNGSTLVVNHEIGGTEQPPVPQTPGLVYDPGTNGGTTNIDVDDRGRRVREYVSLAGTDNNCAGGVTPWGTWLTCEETEGRAGTGTRTKDHGYVFEVAPTALANQGRAAIPLRFLGRFAHEAVAVDPRTSVVYETEDAGNPNGLFFRWTPPAGFRPGPGALHALAQSPGGDTAGTLEALSCYDGTRHVPDLAEATRPGTTYDVRWVDVPDRDARTVSVRKQFNGAWTEGGRRVTRTDGADVTRSRKLEGQWFADGGAYFVASFARLSDGSTKEHDGQVWFLDPVRQTLELKTIFAYTPADQDTDHDGPDNITVSPYGGLVLAEDGQGVQHLVGVTDSGETFELARNEANGSEFTGPVFSPDGKVLFAAIQSGPGYLFAITGPWGKGGKGPRQQR